MRQWLTDPTLLCKQHLLGEHVEHHMMVGAILKGKSIAGFVERGQIDPARIASRHEELVAEMLRRGMQHNSPLLAFSPPRMPHYVRPDRNLQELRRRCAACAERQLALSTATHYEQTL